MTHHPEVTNALKELLANSYVLSLKTQRFHWNVTGPMFTTLHTLFETQYTELTVAIDEIAERIRSLGDLAPGSFAEFSDLATISNDPDQPNAVEMVKQLVDDQQKIVTSASNLLKVAGSADDDVSGDMGIRRMEIHQKNAWMLRSHLE